MEEKGRDSVLKDDRLATRLGVRTALLAILGGGLAFGAWGPVKAAGAGVGFAASGLYVYSYLASHLARPPGSAGRRGVLRTTMLRLTLLVAAGTIVLLAGREMLIGFAAGFGIGFALLVAAEAPRAWRRLRSRAAG